MSALGYLTSIGSSGAPVAHGGEGAGMSVLPLEGASCRRLDADDVVFLEGDEAERVHEIVQGVVRLCRLLPDGRRAVLGFRHPGDLLGLCSGGRHDCTAEAVTPVVLRSCRLSSLAALAEASAETRRRLSSLVWREIDATRTNLLVLGRMSALERVASFLVALSRQHGHATRLHLPMSRTDIADHLGLTIETVSRTLTQMRRRGLIALPSPHLAILLCPDALRDLAAADEPDDAAPRRAWAA